MVALLDPGSPISIYRGDDYSNQIYFRTVNPDKTFSPVNLTTYGNVWNAQLRKTEDAVDFIPFTVDSSLASTGYITISLTASQTTDLALKTGVWDLQVAGTKVKTLVKGTFVVDKDVTRV